MGDGLIPDAWVTREYVEELLGRLAEADSDDLARLHQANRRAAAFEARCAQLLEENERLRRKLGEVEAERDVLASVVDEAEQDARDSADDALRAEAENERLRERLEYRHQRGIEEWAKQADKVRDLKADRDEFKAVAEHWRLFHHKAEQRARDAEAENERLRAELADHEIRIGILNNALAAVENRR